MNSQSSIWNKLYKENKNKWNKETLFLPNLLKNKSVLEIGVGNGKTLKSILKQYPKSVTAIDFSKESIKICKSEFKDKNLKFIKSDTANLPFKDNSFNVIICYYILNNLKENKRKKAVKEIYRVLNRSGLVLFQDFQVNDLRQFGKEIEKNTIVKKNKIIHHFFTKLEVKDLFNQFKIIEIKEKSFTPIKSNKKVVRKLISAVFKK